MRKKMRLALPLWGAALVLAALAVGERGQQTQPVGLHQLLHRPVARPT
jgi:hypothetical protein